MNVVRYIYTFSICQKKHVLFHYNSWYYILKTSPFPCLINCRLFQVMNINDNKWWKSSIAYARQGKKKHGTDNLQWSEALLFYQQEPTSSQEAWKGKVMVPLDLKGQRSQKAKCSKWSVEYTMKFNYVILCSLWAMKYALCSKSDKELKNARK